MAWDAYGMTQRGRGRANNEDSILFPAQVAHNPAGDRRELLAVADGVGGVQGGEAASAAAVAALREGFDGQGAHEPRDILAALFAEANRRVLALRPPASEQGPATTLVAALADANSLWIGSIGDSRAYVFRSGSVTLVTQDHVCEASAATPGGRDDDAAPLRFLTRALGLEGDLNMDVFGPIARSDVDTVLLCSDGLYGVVDEAALARHIGSDDLSLVAQRIVAMAVQAGSVDDISIVLMRS